MATVLALSSSVARGHVGLAALVPVMQRLGHEVIALPSVVLSNHPGHTASSGFRVPVDALDGMLAALQANGWLAKVDAVVTGYLPSADHVAFAARVVETVSSERDRRPLYVCDPVLGDFPQGLYIDPAAADAIRATLLPIADVLTPNAFELGWLAGKSDVGDAQTAKSAARSLPVPHVLATSVRDGAGLANVLVTPAAAVLCKVPRRQGVPHGTGDVLTAQIAARVLPRGPEAGLAQELVRLLGTCIAATALIIEGSLGADELALVSTAPVWEKPKPLTISEF